MAISLLASAIVELRWCITSFAASSADLGRHSQTNPADCHRRRPTLREVCAWPGLHNETFTAAGSKADRLLDLLTENIAAGHHALVFSQWTRILDHVAGLLHKRSIKFNRVDGSMSPAEREREVDAFQKYGKSPVMLLTLGAGGVGLDLQRASYVYLFDPWRNPQRENQAIASARRLGQERQVLAKRPTTMCSVDEKIPALSKERSELFHTLVEPGGGGSKLTVSDILALVSDAKGS